MYTFQHIQIGDEAVIISPNLTLAREHTTAFYPTEACSLMISFERVNWQLGSKASDATSVF